MGPASPEPPPSPVPATGISTRDGVQSCPTVPHLRSSHLWHCLYPASNHSSWIFLLHNACGRDHTTNCSSTLSQRSLPTRLAVGAPRERLALILALDPRHASPAPLRLLSSFRLCPRLLPSCSCLRRRKFVVLVIAWLVPDRFLCGRRRRRRRCCRKSVVLTAAGAASVPVPVPIAPSLSLSCLVFFPSGVRPRSDSPQPKTTLHQPRTSDRVLVRDDDEPEIRVMVGEIEVDEVYNVVSYSNTCSWGLEPGEP